MAKRIDDPFAHNRDAWDRHVAQGLRWTIGVSPEQIAAARRGELRPILTPTRQIPAEWLGELAGRDVLCLASGGGQQGPLLAAAGARVTVFDASPRQLDRDREVAERESLALALQQGDMRDLSRFGDETFDLIVHPVSNCFVAEIRPVWRECYRVLRPGGRLLAGWNNPVVYCFDAASVEQGDPRLAYPLPYADLEHLDVEFVAQVLRRGEPLEYSHTLTDQLGGQIAAGFAITGFYEDRWGQDEFPDEFFPQFIATRADKPVR